MDEDIDFQTFCDKKVSENENNFELTIDFINQDNQDAPDELSSNYYKNVIFSNQNINKNLGQKHIRFETTQDTTIPGNYRKKRKTSYGKWKNYIEHDIIEAPNPINPFFIKNKELYSMTYQYFCEDVAHFISLRAIELKTVIVDYGQIRINEKISYDDNNTKYQLRYIDYNKFCKPHSKEFNERYLDKKLEYLFIEFQDSNNGRCRDQNKKVIKYITNNRNKQLLANKLLDLNFYGLVDYFTNKGLKKYLEEKDKELKELYLKNNIINYTKRIEAFNKIITTLCNNFKEYST